MVLGTGAGWALLLDLSMSGVAVCHCASTVGRVWLIEVAAACGDLVTNRHWGQLSPRK